MPPTHLSQSTSSHLGTLLDFDFSIGQAGGRLQKEVFGLLNKRAELKLPLPHLALPQDQAFTKTAVSPAEIQQSITSLSFLKKAFLRDSTEKSPPFLFITVLCFAFFLLLSPSLKLFDLLLFVNSSW